MLRPLRLPGVILVPLLLLFLLVEDLLLLIELLPLLHSIRLLSLHELIEIGAFCFAIGIVNDVHEVHLQLHLLLLLLLSLTHWLHFLLALLIQHFPFSKFCECCLHLLALLCQCSSLLAFLLSQKLCLSSLLFLFFSRLRLLRCSAEEEAPHCCAAFLPFQPQLLLCFPVLFPQIFSIWLKLHCCCKILAGLLSSLQAAPGESSSKVGLGPM
mmetsp:Transcript_65878/g.157486  ORF Transcript_65878/g.157486 Transcript_65878/m.157486 type:complete len:212 (-) Transcript_65878:449-1084(-)